MAPEGLSPLADHDRADLGERPLSADRLPGYYSAPKPKKAGPKSLDEVDPELLKTYEKLGIPLQERRAGAGRRRGRRGVRQRLGGHHLQGEAGQGRRHLLLVLRGGARASRAGAQKYLGSVVPASDNFFAALNSAVFSDGSFATCRRACAARWSCRPISASTPRPASSSAR
jgi:Fe-S cluster assembly protein SufB